ncbi:MAG: pyruvate dehydrogenase complex dihydrolipoamide acetyltransferase [Alphaproteobacteria bacterium]|nr:pyruvate dehydrogenase complex dihydrolipoamide acetyltransferase [Alphaproteobacteria bacterium]
MPINITMPALSPTMTEGNLAKWLKKEGDKVKPGEVIAEIETDKATMEVEAVDEGILGRILVPAGTEKVPVNDVIAVLLEDGESASSIVIPTGAAPKARAAEGFVPSIKTQDPSAPAKQSLASAQDDKMGGRIKASPLAKRIAAQSNIDLSRIKGTGPSGRIVKSDVASDKLQAGRNQISNNLVTHQEQIVTELPNNQIKKITAARLLESKQTIPHFYLTVECRIDNLLAARAALNEQAKGAYKLSVNDFVIKAAAAALKSYPAANVSWTEKAVLQYFNADISVAVATPNGLITPIIRAAEQKSLPEISAEMKDLAERARAGKLKPQEFQGGTFTISNLGMFGVKDFAAIINPPQSCILAVGAGIEQPVVENGQIKIGTVMSVTLSTDHRSVDGAVGAEWLQHFKRYIENPITMLV